jgi:hypothetical protein
MIAQAIQNLAPGAAWSMTNDSYDELVWLSDDIQKPSKNAVLAEATRLQAEFDAKEYQRQRATAYPPIADQLDTLYHGGYDAWKATITAVKEEFPKP